VQHSRRGIRSPSDARGLRLTEDVLYIDVYALGEGGGSDVPDAIAAAVAASLSTLEQDTEWECRRHGWSGGVRSLLWG
jgi:hypothetical protein